MDAFRIFYDFNSLNNQIVKQYPGGSLGLVPTMGALHDGHISLIKKALRENQVVVVTIFVNPKQFNNITDLDSYPRTIENDCALLSEFENLLVCVPSESDVYPNKDPYSEVELGAINEVLEGRYRPGHFKGVAHVVHNLFHFIQPSSAYFGLKDYQQFAVIKKMAIKSGFDIRLEGCKTIRNKDGFALSSRNKNLNAKEQEASLIIIRTLQFVQENQTQYAPNELKKMAVDYFNQGQLKLEYLDIVTAGNFDQIENYNEGTVCCIAAFCGNVRLIDNVTLKLVLQEGGVFE